MRGKKYRKFCHELIEFQRSMNQNKPPVRDEITDRQRAELESATKMFLRQERKPWSLKWDSGLRHQSLLWSQFCSWEQAALAQPVWCLGCEGHAETPMGMGTGLNAAVGWDKLVSVCVCHICYLCWHQIAEVSCGVLSCLRTSEGVSIFLASPIFPYPSPKLTGEAGCERASHMFEIFLPNVVNALKRFARKDGSMCFPLK